MILRRALDLDSLNSKARILLGTLYAQQDQFAAAARQLERARYLDPTSPIILFHLAEIYRRLGKDHYALREYRSTLARLNHHPPDAVIDGVAVRWLHDTCQRHINSLTTKHC